jgi:hypothetical protein
VSLTVLIGLVPNAPVPIVLEPSGVVLGFETEGVWTDRIAFSGNVRSRETHAIGCSIRLRMVLQNS